MIERGRGAYKLSSSEKRGSLIVDLRYSHTLSQSKVLENHTQTTVISHRRRMRFFSSADLLSRSEFGDRCSVIKASFFYVSRENLGEASRACYESTLISGTSFFSNSIYLRLGEVQIATNENL